MVYKEILEQENFYGHLKRLNWIKSKISKGNTVLEVGCGTGAFITTPLILSGVDAYGIDIGKASIKEAKRIAWINGIDAQRYICADVAGLTEAYDVVICSEVLEHITDDNLLSFVESVCERVKSGGKLIITVPNKSGSYEIGQKYFKKPVRFFKETLALTLEILKMYAGYVFREVCSTRFKFKCLHKKHKGKPGHISGREYVSPTICMSPDDSEHVQWFSAGDILNLIMPKGFRLVEFTGSSMFSGIVINTFFKPARFLCEINNKLGELFPYRASGYYFLFEKLR